MLIYTDEITSSFNSCAVCSFPKTSRVRTNTERDRQRALRTRNETLSHGIAITTRAANDESSSSQWWILIIVQKATQEIKAAEPICDLCNTTSSKANLLPRAGIHLLIKCLHHLWKNRPFFLPFLLSPACKIKGNHKHAFHTAICFVLQN